MIKRTFKLKVTTACAETKMVPVQIPKNYRYTIDDKNLHILSLDVFRDNVSKEAVKLGRPDTAVPFCGELPHAIEITLLAKTKVDKIKSKTGRMTSFYSEDQVFKTPDE